MEKGTGKNSHRLCLVSWKMTQKFCTVAIATNNFLVFLILAVTGYQAIAYLLTITTKLEDLPPSPQ
jgi:hypothetical protein